MRFKRYMTTASAVMALIPSMGHAGDSPSDKAISDKDRAALSAAAFKEGTKEEARFKFSAGADLRYVMGNSGENGVVVDAVELGALAQISKGIRAQGLLKLQEICEAEKSKVSCPKDWNHSLAEAFIQFDLDQMIQKGPKAAILIGRMEVESAPSDSVMAVDNNAPLYPTSRLKTAYAIQVVIDTSKSKIVDEVMIAAINTGPGNEDIQRKATDEEGQYKPTNVNGGMVRISKTLLDKLTITLGLTHIEYRPKAENRINVNATYQITEDWKVFVNAEKTTFSPFYENSKYGVTVGTNYETDKAVSGLEVSRVDKQFTQLAIGYMWKIKPTLQAGFEARHNWCDKNSEQCGKGNGKNSDVVTFATRYMFDQIDAKEDNHGEQPDHCAVGDPGCKPEAKPYANERSAKK
jgi:hypothetical protein